MQHMHHTLVELQPVLLAMGRQVLLPPEGDDADPALVVRWLSIRLSLLSDILIGAVALIAVMLPTIDASTAGFLLAVATSLPLTVSLCCYP